MKLILSSRWVIRESIVSKRSPTKALRSRSSVRTSVKREEDVSHCGGGDSVRSSGMGVQVLLTHPLAIHIFLISKRCYRTNTNRKDYLTLTKGSSSKGILKCWRNKVTRWGYKRGALARCSLPIAVTFCVFMSQGNFNEDLPESAPDHQVFKIKTDESEYRTQETNVSLN